MKKYQKWSNYARNQLTFRAFSNILTYEKICLRAPASCGRGRVVQTRNPTTPRARSTGRIPRRDRRPPRIRMVVQPARPSRGDDPGQRADERRRGDPLV